MNTRLDDHERLLNEAHSLLAFFGQNSVDPDGGYHALDGAGTPISNAPKELFSTCRMVHCFSAAEFLNVEGASAIAEHGLDFLQYCLRDPVHGGYVWALENGAGLGSEKMAYGHAFVLLAAASAKTAGHERAQSLYEDVSRVLMMHFWDDETGAMREEFSAAWHIFSGYRGQNSNMHMVEALMAAYETWEDRRWLTMAERIADLIINRHARAAGWVVIEHFDATWTPRLDYNGDPMFRPAGTTPGHALEWARLCVQLWALGERRLEWLIDAATQLFSKATETAWSKKGGFVYTLDFDCNVALDHRFWWPACEGAAAAASLFKVTGEAQYAQWFDRIWEVLDRDFIDHELGGWWPEAERTTTVFEGKPDIYHALQACLLPLLPADVSLVPGLKARA